MTALPPKSSTPWPHTDASAQPSPPPSPWMETPKPTQGLMHVQIRSQVLNSRIRASVSKVHPARNWAESTPLGTLTMRAALCGENSPVRAPPVRHAPHEVHSLWRVLLTDRSEWVTTNTLTMSHARDRTPLPELLP